MAEAVGFEGANFVFQAPDGVPQEECYDLQCFKAPGRIISCWRLTEEELKTVAETGVVWLEVQSDGLAPMKICGQALVAVDGRPAKAEPRLPRAPRTAPDSDLEPPEPQDA